MGAVLGWMNDQLLKMVWLNDLVGRLVEDVFDLRWKRFTVTSSSSRATTTWPLRASVVRCTASRSPSRMPASRMLMPRTRSR